MKKILTLISIASAFFLGSCSEVVIFEPSDEEIGLYSKVYMPRAESDITVNAISTSGEEQKFIYNAYLGGPVDAPKDIKVTFSVDVGKVADYNIENGTDYKILPESSYTLQSLQAVIDAGSRTHENLEFSVMPGEYFTMFDTYLLPLTISQAEGASLNEELSTVYYVFMVTYEPGQVPRDKVLSLGQNSGTILSNGPRGSLIHKNSINDIILYQPDENGVFNVPPKTIGWNWVDSESFYYVNENSVVARNFPYWAGLWNFRFTDNNELLVLEPHWLGDFWDKYIIVPFKEHFLLVDNEGVMWRQPALAHMNTAKTQVGSGFKSFKQILTYQNTILALEANGNLWLYQVSDLGVPSTRRQVGEGWNMYEKIIVSGSDVLGLDVAGDVYRYDFNPRGYYPVR